MTTALTCGRCAAELRPTAKFCDECGSPTAEARTPAEYKQVTVLFADVVHSMDIAAAVGAERLREIMTELVDRTAAVVRRCGGTVDKFTGDGIMAMFGAPLALEDHAVRACLAALSIQEEATRLADEVARRDAVDLHLRVGLNSGQVIAGEIGSAAYGYTAIGEQVGMAQRMESAAPPDGVMVSESTARLIEGAAALGKPELVRIKGAAKAVPARRLLSVGPQPKRAASSQLTLVGRAGELDILAAMLDRSTAGHGCVLTIVGSPGIGKTRLAGEAMRLAENLGIEVFSTFCESHATELPFHVVARLLRSVGRLGSLDDEESRARLRDRFPGADPQDLVLLDDLLGIADPDVVLPKIDPDARRRRLTALINSAHLARKAPAVFVIEDAHWIDEVSESMLADFLEVIPRTPSLVLITYRPEYHGPLARIAGAQTVALPPLSDSEASVLLAELLGADPSVGQICEVIAGRAAGNPFFAEEMTRDLAERGVLIGERGGYARGTDAAEVSVPATVQATIAARIDRLTPAAKRTLAGAAVVGSRFNPDLLADLDVDPAVGELINAELIDEVGAPAQGEYAFRHPLVRAVAYESQLKSDRARLHAKLAAAIEAREPESADQNAALIAEHLEAAGDLRTAYGWHMRAASWATSRNIGAARLSWERARTIADALPADEPNRSAMRIAPRTMLCGTAYRVHTSVVGERFDELRELCGAAGDKASLAIGMAGQVMDHAYQGRVREASRLAAEAMGLIESLGDASLTVGLSYPAIYAKFECGEWAEVLRWSDRTIELADGDPFKGNFIFGSPLALAFTSRAMARYFLGLPAWHDDLSHGLAMAHSADPLTYAAVVALGYFPGIANGTLVADDRAVREIEDAVGIAQRSGNDTALALARMALGIALVHRQETEHDRGRALLAEVSDVFTRRAHNLGDRPLVDVYVARERARGGDHAEAIPLMRAGVDHLAREGQLPSWGVAATGVLVEALLDCPADADLAEAEEAIERLAAAPADADLVLRDIWLLRLRALLARGRGDVVAYAGLRDRYHDMAKTLGFEGHIAWANAMP